MSESPEQAALFRLFVPLAKRYVLAHSEKTR